MVSDKSLSVGHPVTRSVGLVDHSVHDGDRGKIYLSLTSILHRLDEPTHYSVLSRGLENLDRGFEGGGTVDRRCDIRIPTTIGRTVDHLSSGRWFLPSQFSLIQSRGSR